MRYDLAARSPLSYPLLVLIQEFYDDHGPLKPGVTRTIPHNSASTKFEIVAQLVSLPPERWTVKVTLFGETVLKLDEDFPSKYAAGNAAEARLRAHLIRLFKSNADPGSAQPSR